MKRPFVSSPPFSRTLADGRHPLREQVNSLQHFQQHSRLHFIGQWRTRANEELAKWFQQHPEWNHGKLSQQSVFVHIDMDAFFCSVQLAKEQYKDLRELPVAIAAGSHNSDISSCNYVARARGVYAGMYVNSAKLVCPDLVVLGYDLQACERVAKHLYEILLTSTEPSMHMAMEVYSIDEVMMAFDNLDYDGLRVYCERVRERLREETGCTASCGIGPNIMLARLSTERAKPDGIYMVRPEDVARVMRSIAFSSVHGVGDVTLAKVLEAVNGLRGADDAIHDPTHLMCTDVQRLSIEALQAVLGKKAGQSFYNLCRGVDGRVVLRTGDAAEQQTKGIPSSVGCSMNYAVRPHTVEDVWSIAAQLLDDVCRKLQLHNATASGLRMTLLERHPLHSRETQKFLGRGRCLEFHFSTRFAHPLLSSNADLMLAALSTTIAPFLTLSREQSDENRAAELGLCEDSGEMEWTVNIAEAKNIVVCDVRGMTVQATGLKVIEEVAVDRTIRGGAGQLTLASAFAKGKRRRTEAVEVGATQLSQRQWPTTVLSLTDDGTPVSQHDFFFAQPWDEHVDVVWRSELRRAATQRDYPYAKALLRWAMVKVMESGGDDAAHFGQHFGSLLDYSRTVLDVEIDFL